MPVINGSTGESAMGLTSLVSVDGVVPAVLVAQAALKPKAKREATARAPDLRRVLAQVLISLLLLPKV